MNPVRSDNIPPTGRPNTRESMSSRISRLFDRRQDQDSSANTSHRTSGACEVPIFMSPSSDHLLYPLHDEEMAMSPPLGPIEEHHRDHSVPASSVYSQSPVTRAQRISMDEIEEEAHLGPPETVNDLESGISYSSRSMSEVELVKEKRRRRRRAAESYREKIAAKKKLGMAFGVTTLAAVITCK